MVLGGWLKEKVREQQRKELADRIDKLYGEGTYARLEEEKNQKSEESNGNAGWGQRS